MSARASLWTFRDLPDDELAWYTRQPCECKPPSETGTLNGFTCAAHRAQAEIDRREQEYRKRIEALRDGY